VTSRRGVTHFEKDGFMNSRSAIVLGIVVLAAFAHPLASHAGRCQSKISVSAGLHCKCPDFAALLNDDVGRRNCPPGWTPVIYNVDPTTPFAGDGTSTSSVTTHGDDSTTCSGIVDQSKLSGQVVGCWGPADTNGCRPMKMADDGACFVMDSVPTSPTTDTSIVAVANAGASLRVCPPKAPATSCRGTAAGRVDENPRFWWGGFCATTGCTGTSIDAGACNAAWGATYFGYGGYRGPDAGIVPSNWYDWASGEWKIVSNHPHHNCGVLASCLGQRRRAYTIQAVLIPAAGYLPPCLTSGATCSPSSCFQ
jgi:hypothetical protein